MNRLQKKCLIATAGGHLLLILILLVGPGFFTSRPKPDDTQLLDVIPPTLIDEAFNSGVKNVQPPPLAPPVVQPEKTEPVTPPPPPPPKPEPPKVKPEPVKQPDPDPVKPPDKLSPEALTPVKPKPPKQKPKEHEVKADLTKRVKRVVPDKPDNSEAENEARLQQQRRDAKLRAIARAATAIRDNSSSSTEIEMPGNSTESYANYAAAVKSKYEAAWILPDDSASDDANVKVSVTIARDGSVVTSRILDRSGDSKVDASIQRTLDRVTFVAPFRDGSKDRERTFIIYFNLKAKRMLG